MRHCGRWCCAVPVLLTGRKEHDIAGPDFFDRAALGLNPAQPGRDDQSLAERMRMPGGTGARLEGDADAIHAYWITHLKHRFHANRPAEIRVRRFGGRARTISFDIHCLSPFWYAYLC